MKRSAHVVLVFMLAACGRPRQTTPQVPETTGAAIKDAPATAVAPAAMATEAPVAEPAMPEAPLRSVVPARPMARKAGGSVALLPSGGSMGALGAPAQGVARHGAPLAAVGQEPEFNTEGYAHMGDNPFLSVAQQPLSTFSVDVDTASYSNVRRFLSSGQLPPKDAVRVEELLNYFPYSYAGPSSDAPFAVQADLTDCPWAPSHRLLRIGLQGSRLDESRLPARNLVFLVDVSGSMNDPRKLPLVQSSLRMLTERLRPIDSISMVVYAGSTGLVLPPTSGDQKDKILHAIDRLEAGGSTNGASGIQLAYEVARRHFAKGGVNRVILATDGDFNVGITNEGDLVRLIETERKSGTFLTVLGFGMGNLKDSTMETLADHGNGNYAYIDSFHEAKKVLVAQGGGTLVTIAKDVKLQLEFNPARVSDYRLIGYENRVLRNEDFKDDTKDAGDIGAGHSVTALYELTFPSDEGNDKTPPASVDALKYQTPRAPTDAARAHEVVTLKLRFKAPNADTSREIAKVVGDEMRPLGSAPADLKFAVAVAGFGLLLRDSPHKGTASFGLVERLAREGAGADELGYRREFVELVATAARLKGTAIAE